MPTESVRLATACFLAGRTPWSSPRPGLQKPVAPEYGYADTGRQIQGMTLRRLGGFRYTFGGRTR
jgi:hypothetical protein